MYLDWCPTKDFNNS